MTDAKPSSRFELSKNVAHAPPVPRWQSLIDFFSDRRNRTVRSAKLTLLLALGELASHPDVVKNLSAESILVRGEGGKLRVKLSEQPPGRPDWYEDPEPESGVWLQNQYALGAAFHYAISLDRDSGKSHEAAAGLAIPLEVLPESLGGRFSDTIAKMTAPSGAKRFRSAKEAIRVIRGIGELNILQVLGAALAVFILLAVAVLAYALVPRQDSEQGAVRIVVRPNKIPAVTRQARTFYPAAATPKGIPVSWDRRLAASQHEPARKNGEGQPSRADSPDNAGYVRATGVSGPGHTNVDRPGPADAGVTAADKTVTSLLVQPDADATVAIDDQAGVAIQAGQVRRFSVLPGNRVVHATAGEASLEKTVEVKYGEQRTVPLELASMVEEKVLNALVGVWTGDSESDDDTRQLQISPGPGQDEVTATYNDEQVLNAPDNFGICGAVFRLRLSRSGLQGASVSAVWKDSSGHTQPYYGAVFIFNATLDDSKHVKYRISWQKAPDGSPPLRSLGTFTKSMPNYNWKVSAIYNGGSFPGANQGARSVPRPSYTAPNETSSGRAPGRPGSSPGANHGAPSVPRPSYAAPNDGSSSRAPGPPGSSHSAASLPSSRSSGGASIGGGRPSSFSRWHLSGVGARRRR